jgi:hypothetical protein
MHNKTDVDSCQRAIRAIEIETAILEFREYGGTGVRGSENTQADEGNLVPPYPRTSAPPNYPYTYLYNISNHLSQQFYGAKDLSAYELKGGDGPIMQCRHCIRYALGYCVKHGGQRPTWKEPLSLVLGDGRRFRLEFDCKHCQMNVFSMHN